MRLSDIVDDATIMVVDDEPYAVEIVETLLRESGFRDVVSARTATEMVSLLAEVHPDLVLLDWHLSDMEAETVIRVLREMYPDEVIPVIVLTADLAGDVKLRALRCGATEFLNKPFSSAEVLLRVRNLLEMRWLYRELATKTLQMEWLLNQRERDLELSRLEILERLARAAEFRDDTTGEHIVRVGRLSEILGRIMGFSEEILFSLRHAAPLHDLGKIAISDAILRKPGKLNLQERHEMRKHTLIGAQMLEGCSYPAVAMARQIALSHHERWDGRGYPCRLKGTEIPIWGRIVALADAYDAMTHDRPYRTARTHEEAVEEIRAQRGKQFDPMVVDAFLEPQTFAEYSAGD